MTDKDNSLEEIFYRLMSRQVPKQFHARVMGLFRKAATRHETDGDGRIRKAEPRPPQHLEVPPT